MFNQPNISSSYPFFQNLPFGETMVALGGIDYDNPYKFNGKELDEETGNYYYGARYYNPKVSQWLSIDPLAEKYAGFSPYNYVLNNPINLIDPDGRYFLGKDKKRAYRIRRRAKRRKKRFERKANRLEKKGKDVSDLRERIKELSQTIDDINVMDRDDDVQYHYASASGKEAKLFEIDNKPQTRFTGTNSNGHDIITMFTGSTISQKIHETRHGGDHARGIIDAKKQIRGIDAEVRAFRAEYSWDGKFHYMIWDFNQKNPIYRKILNAHMPVPGTIKTINSIFDINAKMVKEIGEFATDPELGTYVIPIYTNP